MFTGILDFLGKMGLTLKGDPPRKIDMTGRVFGPAVDGLALSIRQILKNDPAELVSISVVMKNSGTAARTVAVSGWLFFYEIEINAGLTAWGRESLKPERKTPPAELTLKPGDATETDLPLGALYAVRRGGNYRACVRTALDGGAALHSNEITLE